VLIRLAFGSRAGHVCDMSPHEARAMLADGRATLVAGDPIVDTRDPVLVSSQMADPVPVFAAAGVPRRRRR
jgi:hypothetical protein